MIVGEFALVLTTSVVAEAPTSDSQTQRLPLCVDLDGTLVRSDTLLECVFALGPRWPLLEALGEFTRGGRAAFKRRIVGAAKLDPSLLPYNSEFLQYLREQKAGGRRLVLATAADAAMAQAVADDLQLFDEVVASDGVDNLKGAAKADALVRRFGKKGFVYAG